MSEITETLVPIVTDAPTTLQETVLKDGQGNSGTDPAPSKEPAIEEPKEDPKFSQRFAALSRKEKELVQRERSFKENQTKLQAYEKALAGAKSNPLEYLQAAGLTLEQALQQIINQDGDQPVTEAHRLQQIEQKIADYEKSQEELRVKNSANRKAFELDRIKGSINDFIQSNPETYELVKEYNAIEDVWSVIERTFIETSGQVHLTMEQASQAVEDQLLKEEELAQERRARIKKLNKNIQPSSAEESIRVRTEDKVRIPSQTLTNQSVSASTEPKKFKSREESLADAAKLLKWK